MFTGSGNCPYFWNTEIQNIHKSLTPDSSLYQLNPVHTFILTSYQNKDNKNEDKIRFKIILPSTQ